MVETRRRFLVACCFVPRAWVPHVQDVQVGSFQDWRQWSDDRPLLTAFADLLGAGKDAHGMTGEA